MKEITFDFFENVKIGHAHDEKNATGCTVMIFPQGAAVGLDIKGGGPASRESALLDPLSHAQAIHAILFSGGSAFGLDATKGVMNYLEERSIGFPTGVATVPLVCTSCIFDLVVGSADVRPDSRMAYEACLDAEKNIPKEGNIGVGMGASVGKFKQAKFMMKSGLGLYAVQIGSLKVGALVVVNALGDVYEDGKIIAGMLNETKTGFADTDKSMFMDFAEKGSSFTANTTLGAIFTNASFNKTELTKIAAMGQNGFARAISPVHTMADGDSVYAVSLGDVRADINAVGTLGARVMEKAIINAVKSAKPLYGLKSAKCLDKRA